MNTLTRIGVPAVFLFGAAYFAAAQPSQDLQRTLRRLFDAKEFTVKPFEPVRWDEGSETFTTIEPLASPEGTNEIVRYDARSGARQVLVAAAQLSPPESGKPLSISNFELSRDGRFVLVFANAQKVWRQKTRGDYWVLDKQDGSWRKLGGNSGRALMFAKFSPKAGRVAYVRENNIYVQDLRTAAIRQLTSDGSGSIINGASDWVYEEEFSVRDGFRWSPDGEKIAYWQFDTTGVPEFTLVNYTDALYPILTRFPYPKAGQTNSAVRIGVVAGSGGATRWIGIDGDPRNQYIPRMEWAGNSRELVLERLNRLQNTNDVLLADAGTGSTRRIFRDHDAAWVDAMDSLRWIDGATRLLWTSEQDGWNHAYTIARGGETHLVTHDPADVLSITAADPTGDWLYYIASPGNAAGRYLYRTRIDGNGKSERLTPSTTPGWHSYEISPNTRWALHTYSKFNRPPVTELIRLPGHESVRVLRIHPELDAKVAQLFGDRPEFFQVDIGGGVALDGWTIKPRDFDAGKKYPVIVYVYGEPAGVTVTDSWSERNAFHCALADEGYIIASFDNRGTPAPKGRAWRKIVYGSVGVLSSKEQAAALRAFAAARPYVDLARAGVWGWSGGASNTLNLMFRSPELYQVGVAVAPVPDQRLYDTIYQERYMGLPEQNAEGYRTGSPINFAEGLRGKLLIVHGTGDDNVHFQGTQRLINRLVELEKPFDFMEYPNRSHAIDEGKGTELHIYSLIARYFLEHLQAGGRAR